jgi:hypothetical protein
MPGKGLVPQFPEPCALRPSRKMRAVSGGVPHREHGAASGAASRFARAAEVAPQYVVVGSVRNQAAVLIATGLVAMAVGLLVYLTDRDVSRAALIPSVAALAGSNLFGAMGQWLPSLVHPFAFGLLTAATNPSRSSAGYLACIAWWAVNVVFEVAQHPGINRSVAEAAAAVFGPSWVEHLLSSYVLRGTFDVGDLIAATAGAAGAASLLYVVHRLEVNHGR